MAEAIHDDHSPLARFLRQNDHADDTELASTADARDTAAHDSSPSTSHRPLPTTSTSPPPPPPQPHKRSRRQVAAVERVKYAIATSALLSAKLADALQVYPPLDSLEARQPASRTDTASSRPRSARKRSDKGKGKERAKAADWGSGWETRGQGVTERGVLGSAQAALSGLVGALGRLSTRDDHVSLESVVEEESDAAQAPSAQGPAPPQDALLATVEDFVAASQELDLRVATALTAIKELECIAHGLGLSDPLPPISRIEARGYLASPKPTSPTSAAMLSTPSRSPRIPSPLGGPSRASPPRTSDSESSSPPPLRALALRNALADALASALDALSTSTSALNALLPSNSPLLTLTSASASMTPTSSQSHAPQASLSELLRHDSLARAERTEVSRWEEGSSAPSASSRPSSVHLPDGVDPFHPTDSTFGGIDRRTGESGTPQRAAAGKQHRLRVSLGPHYGGGGSGNGGGGGSSSTEAVGPGGAGARRKRPVSMGGLDSLPPAPSAEQDRAGPSAATHRALLVTLQDRFDDAHDARRGVLWRLLESLDHAESDEAWLKAEAALAALRAVLARAAADVAQAHAREFPDAAAAGGSPTAASTAASGSSAAMGPRAGAGAAAGAGVEAREKRRRSGYYGRPEADDLFPLSASSSSAPTWGAPPTPTPAARRPAAYADYAPSSAPPPPRRAALHMHAPSVSALDPTLSAHAQSMLLSLRAVQAKVRVVLADAAGARVGSATERERVLEVWESVGAEMRRLESGWRDGSGALRSALGLAVEKVEVRERVEEVEREEGGSASVEQDEARQEVSDELNATGAVYATLDSSAIAGDDDLISSRQAMLDAALSASLLPPPDSTDGVDSSSKEKVFEAVAGADVHASAGVKLSRDERIRRMKEAREALALGRSSLESPVKGGPGDGGGPSGGAESQHSIVGELREVLKELNRDKGRADPPSSAPAVDAAPPPRSTPAPPQPVTTRPPPALGSLSPPPPPPAAQAPTARVSPLQPAYEQLPPPSPTKSIPSPTTQRVPPPPLARRLSQSPQTAPLLATPPRLPLPSLPGIVTQPSAPLARPAAQYPSPTPLPPPVPAVPSTPGKQQAPRYVSPPPPSSANRARAGSSTAFATFSPPGSAPATPGKQQVPRYVAPPPARAAPPAPLLPSPRYSASSSSMGLGSPTGPLSPVRAAPPSPLRATGQEADERRVREGSEHARAQGPPSAPQQQQQSTLPPQRVKRPSVQTV